MLGSNKTRKVLDLKSGKVKDNIENVIIRDSTFIFFTDIHIPAGRAAEAWH
jgi:hypothetical protein